MSRSYKKPITELLTRDTEFASSTRDTPAANEIGLVVRPIGGFDVSGVEINAELPAGTQEIGLVGQGTPAAATAPWPVQLSDGSAAITTLPVSATQLPAALVGGSLDVALGAELPAGTQEIGSVKQGVAAAATAPWAARLSDGSAFIDPRDPPARVELFARRNSEFIDWAGEVVDLTGCRNVRISYCVTAASGGSSLSEVLVVDILDYDGNVLSSTVSPAAITGNTGVGVWMGFGVGSAPSNHVVWGGVPAKVDISVTHNGDHTSVTGTLIVEKLN